MTANTNHDDTASAGLTNLYRWCAGRAAAFRDWEDREVVMYPGNGLLRDSELVSWVVRALANPGCDGAAAVLEEIDRARATRASSEETTR
jgi:hypothetical protein